MKFNEEFFINLYKDGKILIDFDNGLIYSFYNGVKRLIGSKMKNFGRTTYVHISCNKMHIYAHRLIWIAFYGDIAENYQINHKNGNKRDNRIDNLEAITCSDNHKYNYRVLKNRSNIGENNRNSKLTWDDIVLIRQMWGEGIHNYKLYLEKFGLSKGHVWEIVTNRAWKNSEEESRKRNWRI